MKNFLLVTTGLLVGAILAAVGTFIWLTQSLSTVAPVKTSDSANTPESSVTTGNSSTVTKSVPPEGIPLRTLPLSDGQKSALKLAGVDVETAVITPDMQTCANDHLGTERMNEIIAGAAPSMLETTKLLPCLGAN